MASDWGVAKGKLSLKARVTARLRARLRSLVSLDDRFARLRLSERAPSFLDNGD